MQAIYDVLAPAKLNLFLHITGRRPDGYHLMQSVFMLIDWCDTLHFERRSDGHISRTDVFDPVCSSNKNAADEPLPADDLCVRAAKALQHACGTSYGVNIRLEKRIPSQAGMGGGSTDAASCLLALQRLWGVRLPDAELLTIAARLGADVPFFLSRGHAWVEGIGDRIRNIELPSADFLVVKPAAGLSTKAIFKAHGLKKDSETATLGGETEEDFLLDQTLMLSTFGRNDLQSIALNLCPEISQSLDWLISKNLQGRMTGSGSAVFAKIPVDSNFLSCATCLSDAPVGCKIRLCSNLKLHPLIGW